MSIAGRRLAALPNSILGITEDDSRCLTLPAKTERYGAFVQASQKLDGLK